MPLTLENWNALISTTLHPSNEKLSSLSSESLKLIIQESNAEADKVRTVFLEGILERPKIKDKQEYVKLNQAMLIRMLDKLYFYRKEKNLAENILQLFDAISGHLKSMLDFIEDFFGNYFDRNEKVPFCYLEDSIIELCKQVNLLEAHIQPLSPYINAIGNILGLNFKTFCEQKKNAATYNELSYQKELMKQLLLDDTLSSEITIREVLFYFNYNDDEYIAYLFEKLALLTQSAELKNEKISLLRFEQKKFNQLPARLNCIFASNMPPLKEQVNGWIEEEIKFLEIDGVPINTSYPISISKEEKFIQVPFKGPEIYLLHKSFIDSGGATSETYKSLFDKTASRLANKNQKGFSSENLQKCSDRVDPEARENVKRFLQKMIRNIDSY